MNFQPVGTSGAMEISDCKRYTITRAWNTERWDAWLVMFHDFLNERLAKNLDKDAARNACERHHAGPRGTK